MHGFRSFGSPPPMSSRHRNLEPLRGGTRQYLISYRCIFQHGRKSYYTPRRRLAHWVVEIMARQGLS